jgi:hypothetical protein
MVKLTGRQRDFLASYPDELTVEIDTADSEGDPLEEGEIRVVYDGDEIWSDFSELVVPAEGFLDQPHVTLSDWEEALDKIPVRAYPQELRERARERSLDALPDAAQHAFMAMMSAVEREYPEAAIRWDDALRVVYEGIRA